MESRVGLSGEPCQTAPVSATVAELVEANDADALLRAVDGLCVSRDWDGLVDLRDRCREAVSRGKQLWGVAYFAEYRLALESPAAFAGPVVHQQAARFTFGPVWEVAASTHRWDELDPHVPSGPFRTLAAHERMIRGDAVDVAEGDPLVLDLPLHLASWEPAYDVAVYRADGLAAPDEPGPAMPWIDLPEAFFGDDDPEGVDALFALVRPWIDESNGRWDAAVVAGTALEAIRAVGPRRVRAVEISGADAVRYMAWTAASGGAFGRRRGTPVGRHDAWWAASVLAGMDWPVDASELGAALDELTWYRWDPGEATGGWHFHLAVEDPEHGVAWAASAVDGH